MSEVEKVTKQYEVLLACKIAGGYVAKGALLDLHPKQAEFHLLKGDIKPKKFNGKGEQ